ncbi:malonate decarboxylase holo-[acyl-carrier-protein] synthase [Massilia niabensis]|uniref:Malonate decarboxylase holo-[acyl-carrier-protein] synthase n=1 Tax=Massilia niabensis TaxID=544910 RepID=A0ABW0L5F2_9BURK
MLARPELARHNLVWLSQAGWERAAALAAPGARDAGDARAAIMRWGRARWPAVATRVPPGLAPGDVPLGLALPPSASDGAKPRIAFIAHMADIADTCPALPLAQALPAVPEAWRGPLTALLDEAGNARLDVRVYGSVALQALTGQGYLTAASDIDLLLAPRTLEAYRCALGLLARHALLLPLDGEIVFPQGWTVAWKELLHLPGATARVLAKSLRGAELVTVGSLLAALRTDRCTA